jgi:hypothetical protein
MRTIMERISSGFAPPTRSVERVAEEYAIQTRVVVARVKQASR